MKTKEELNALKEEVETLNKKLAELTEEELEQVAGGSGSSRPRFDIGDTVYCQLNGRRAVATVLSTKYSEVYSAWWHKCQLIENGRIVTGHEGITIFATP